MAFDDARLPVNVETEAEGGPTFSTGIITMSNGVEQRVQNWSTARSVYKIGYGISESDWPAVRAFFYARRGRARGFRFKDWTDFEANRELCQRRNGHLTLAKTYADDLGIAYIRGITRIVPGTLKIETGAGGSYVDVTGQFTESYGMLVGNDPGGDVFASFEFDVPARFDVDDINITASTVTAALVEDLSVIEIIEDTLKLNGL